MDDVQALGFLDGGGEMGARMRAFDWTSTPLGSPAGWPQSLKTIVRMMLDSRFAMWMAWGPDHSFFCNDAYLPTLGLKRDWALASRADLVWAEVWHAAGPRIDHVLKTGQATWDEGLELFLRRSGYEEETFHTFSYSPVHDDDHHVAGMLCVVVETTESVIGERRLELLRALAAVSASESESLDDAGRRMLALLAPRTRDLPFAALYFLETAAGGGRLRLVGSTCEPSTGRLPASVALDDTGSPWLMGAALISGQPQHLTRLHEVVEIPGAWAAPLKEALVMPLHGSGQARRLGVLVLGVSPRRRLDEPYLGFMTLVASQVASRLADALAHVEARERAQALAELDQAKSLFFSNVSHEFRTPLTLMLGPIDELLEGGTLPAAQAEALALAQRNGQRLRKLVNSLLDFSRIEAGRVAADRQPTDLAEATADLASTFRTAIEQAGLTLEVDCPPLPAPVWVDRDMWEKMVLNLLSNALKFTFAGGIGVRLMALDDGRQVRLEVTDTGVGIPAADLPRLFERFQRLQGTRSRIQEGTGIGLALVKELARLHGGSVSVASTEGRGSCFSVTLPCGEPASAGATAAREASGLTPLERGAFVDDALRASAPSAPPAGPAPRSEPATGPRFPGEQVLVVDDNAEMRGYIERLLRPHWQVRVARDGWQALQMIEDTLPDVVVTDVMMPGLDGRGLLARIRGHQAARGLPVIMLSAEAGEEARLATLGQGADDYLVKPFSARELVARIEVQLARARLRRAQEAADKRLAEVFANAPVGFALLMGRDHVFEHVNSQLSRMLHHRRVLRLPAREAFPELEGQGPFELLAAVYETGSPYVGRSYPVQLRDATGQGLEARFFDFVYQPLFGADGRCEGIGVVCFDVTGLMRARQEAEQASRAKDEFIAMLGHELRNPLAPMLTALQLMQMQWPGIAQRERGILERQVRHMVRLVDDLLDVARITRGGIELRKETVELRRIVDAACETAGPVLEQRRHRLTVDVQATGALLLADPVRLSQVVSNLLTNAARFTEMGGDIRLHSQVLDGQATLTVTDNGVGMTEAELATVFDLFVQGRQAMHRPQGGLGLGLSIARSLAALHRGTLSAFSAGIGSGSSFVLTLPLAGPDPAPAPDAPPTDMQHSGAAGRVLVVDDNDDAAQSLSALLQTLGYETLVAHDGPQALRLLEHETVNAAILDIGLPVMDGYELALRLRQRPLGSALRLVALSGYGQDRDFQRSRDTGLDAHLVKPVDVSSLLRALQGAP